MIIKTHIDEIQDFLHDASNFKGSCSAVYFPQSENEISALLRQASAARTPVTIAGGGTGLTGARVPEGGIVLAVSALNRIGTFDKDAGSVSVQSGVYLSVLQEFLREQQYFYPPDPTETNCFIGGTIAANASGARTFKFGPTRAFVRGLRVVLANGDTLALARGSAIEQSGTIMLHSLEGNTYVVPVKQIAMPSVKNAAGYYLKSGMDAVDLFIGSEGTLGVITEAELSIEPLPERILSCLAFFPSEEDGLHFIERARSLSRAVSILSARALEFFDSRSLRFLAPYYSFIDPGAHAAVWFEQDTTAGSEDGITEAWLRLIEETNGNGASVFMAADEKDRSLLHEFRHAISYRVNEYVTQKGFRKLGTDTAVLDVHFVQYYAECKQKVESAGLAFVAYGHFGNSHVHLNMLPATEQEFETGKLLYAEFCRSAAALGGTVSAEHGIGKSKKQYLRFMYTQSDTDAMIAVKKALDPALILGRGTLFDIED